MVTESEKLDHWRKYFRTANSDIFDVIGNAILVAATDWPKEFRIQRTRIVESLFSCQLARCSGCDHVELPVPARKDGNGEIHGKEDDVEKLKDSNIDRVNNFREDTNSTVTALGFEEAKLLTEEIEEECETTREVLRIKEVIANQNDQSEDELFNSLRRLQLMNLSFGALEATCIGKAVNCLRKHRSKRIRQIVHALIDGWKGTVDQWLKTATAIAERTPDSVNSSYTMVEEEELPQLPLDAGAFLPIGTGIELSEFFDGMDEDGNLCNSGDFSVNGNNGAKAVPENPSKPIRKLQPAPVQPSIPDNNSQMRNQEAINKHSKQQETLDMPTRRQEVLKQGETIKRPIKEQEIFNKTTTHTVKNSGTGPGRPLKLQEPALVRKKPQDNCKYLDEAEDGKLEAAKRKLHEGYMLAETAKKQRTIQIMELHDLPKQGLPRQAHPKQGLQNRCWANGRH